MSDPARWAISIVAAYLIGSIPFGLLLGRIKGMDLRTRGSGNIGATNALRVLGRPLGILCLALDIAKGAVPVALAGWWLGAISKADPGPAQSWWWMGVAAGAVGGHMFSAYLKFTGGKGVATGLGAMLGVWPHLTIPGLLAALTWIIAARITKYVSVASCIAAATLPVWVILVRLAWGGWRSARHESAITLAGAWPFAVAGAVMAGLILWKHRGNLARVRNGTEPRLGDPAR